jgi:hypothetical protein
MRWIDPGRSADCVHGVAVWLATLAVLVLSYGTHESVCCCNSSSDIGVSSDTAYRDKPAKHCCPSRPDSGLVCACGWLP